MNLSLVDTDARIWDFFIADVTSLLEFLVNRLDVLVEVGDGESLATVWTLGALVVVHLPDVPRQVGHGKLLVAVGARLLDPLMSLSDMAREVVHGNVLPTVRAVCLLTKMDALYVVVEKFLGLELLLAVGTFVVSDLLVEILDVMVQILVLLVADVTG